jgi:geranyl-CoA carboxylase alpha subunit
VRFARDGDALYFLHRGISHVVRDLTRAAPDKAAASGGDGKIRAAMNGRVVALLAKVGDTVVAGAPIVTLEAMKMEHVHAAGLAGTLTAVHIVEGDQVTTGRIVAEITPHAAEEAPPG